MKKSVIIILLLGLAGCGWVTVGRQPETTIHIKLPPPPTPTPTPVVNNT